MGWGEKRMQGGKVVYRAAYRDRDGKQLYVKDEDNPRKHMLFPSEAKAIRAANVAEEKSREAKRKRVLKSGSYGEFIAAHWDDRKVLPSTAKKDWTVMERHVLPQWKPMGIVTIDRDEVGEWIEALSATRAVVWTAYGDRDTGHLLKPATVHRIFYLFASTMTLAVKKRWIDYTPCQFHDLPMSAPPDERFLKEEEYADIRANAPNDHMRVFADLGVGTGGRYGELTGLHRNRIDTKNKVIVFQETFNRVSDCIKLYPKSGKRRGVPIADDLAYELDEYMKTYPAVPCRTPHMDANGDVFTCNSSLLLTRHSGRAQGEAWNYDTTREAWVQMVLPTGLGRVRIHDLRHTYASWLIQRGISKDELQQLLGHSTVIITERYAHLAGAHWGRVRAALLATPTNPVPPTTPAGLVLPNGATSGFAPQLLPDDGDDRGAKIIPFRRIIRSAG